MIPPEGIIMQTTGWKRAAIILGCVFVLALGAGKAEASLYRASALGELANGVISGSRTADGGGLVGTQDWDRANFSITWTITQQQGGAWDWLYEYTIAVPKKDVSHAIIEITPGAGENDFSFTSDDAEEHEIGTYDGSGQGNSNPGIPGSIFGIKFDGVSSGNTVALSFYTDKSPVYGHFYTKSGKSHGQWVYAYNEAFDPGFLSPHESGAYVVTPDGLSFEDDGSPVPVPATVWLLGSALFGLPALVRRSRKG